MLSALRRWRPEYQKYKVLFGHTWSLRPAWIPETLSQNKAKAKSLGGKACTAYIPQSPQARAGDSFFQRKGKSPGSGNTLDLEEPVSGMTEDTEAGSHHRARSFSQSLFC